MLGGAKHEESSDRAIVHLRILGQDRVFEVGVPLGKRRLEELLPSARELSAQATTVAIARAEAAGRAISCRSGCGACCRQLVAVSGVEAHALAKLVDAWPAERRERVRQRFAAAVARLEAAGLLDPNALRGRRPLVLRDVREPGRAAAEVGPRYFELHIACPFLEDEACSVREERPMVCREYHVSTPAERCAALYGGERVEKVDPPLHMSWVMTHVANAVAETGRKNVPLVLALEWSHAHGHRLERRYDGLTMFRTMLSAADPEHGTPFDGR